MNIGEKLKNFIFSLHNLLSFDQLEICETCKTIVKNKGIIRSTTMTIEVPDDFFVSGKVIKFGDNLRIGEMKKICENCSKKEYLK